MKTYALTTPKDANGQPLRMFKANLENNVSKAIDQLSGICSGILADGVVTEQEATFSYLGKTCGPPTALVPSQARRPLGRNRPARRRRSIRNRPGPPRPARLPM